MKVLILGIDGMIGHKIAQSLSRDFVLFGSTRKNITIDSIGLKSCCLVYYDFLIKDNFSIFEEINPDVIINCIGITTRRGVSLNTANTKHINEELPHRINEWTTENEKKLIHFSTDCVFSGTKGNYLDNDTPNAEDLYGVTKGKGELNNDKALTIRCSTIGREIYNHTELFEWLYSMKNKHIEGYSDVIYSGVTTLWMGKVILQILKKNIGLSGIYNISSEPISKYHLLLKLSEAFKLNINISENSNIKSNKVLNSKKFTEITGIKSPNWDDLIPDFKNDCKKYANLYKN
tara:strand:+ start:22239 stop:23108 length:870 start_codon:yes stop_codon:yes gene_type:complete